MQQDYFILLLSKRFSGEITPAESLELDDYLRQSPDHAALAGQYQTIWEKSDGPPFRFDLNLDAEFQRLQLRLAIPQKSEAKVLSLGGRLWRVAAALVFLLAAVWGYNRWNATASMIAESTDGADKHEIELSDGTRVWLRKGAVLEHPRTFDAHTRLVKLSGEAYFEVAKDAGRPFKVALPFGGKVEVLGTHFNVQADGQGNTSSVLVREGKVRFSPDGKHAGAVLTARKKAVYDRQSAQLRVSTPNTFNELAWQTGGLEFIRTPLHEVVSDLERFYGVKITLEEAALRNCLHTAPLTSQPLKNVLLSLELTYQLKISNPAPGEFILSGGSCK